MLTTKEIRVSDAIAYERNGFVVEQLRHSIGDDEPHWCVPGWVEDQWGETGFFSTEEEAIAFLEMVTS